jgi:predicted TIM-barrel fold metal-dependent hydrolase
MRVCSWPPALKLRHEFFGSDRIMFGTDHMFWPTTTAMKAVGEVRLSDDVREAIMSSNARRLFRILATDQARVAHS